MSVKRLRSVSVVRPVPQGPRDMRFLGYELVNQQANDKLDRNGRRKVNGRIGLRVPAKVIEQHCQAYMVNDKPTHRNELLADDDYTIISRYQAEFRGVVQY